MEQKYIVAFEIGSSSIKGTVAVASDDSGHINVLAVAEEPIRDKVRYGLVENPSEVASTISAIVRRLQQTHGVAPRMIRSAYVGISGRSVASIPCSVTRDFHAELEVTDNVVDDILNEAIATPIGDKSVVNVLPVSFSIDGSTVSSPVGEFGHSISAKVNLITCKPKMKNNLNRVFHERCGINIAGYVVTPIALAKLALTPEERRLGVMFVDFGAETTSIVLYRGGVLQYISTIPIGSRNITRDLTSLNFLEERAEEIKKAVGDAMPQNSATPALVTDGHDNSEINNILAARADEIVSNIIEHINYAELKREQLPAGIVLAGGGSRLRNFMELLAKLSKMKTRMASISSSITLSTHDIPADRVLDVTAIASAVAATDKVTECTEM
ncbi:MAG: cell division protein FtsA, partial [Muribaculaceae bacterium]|nr:cell division protein FtsA [Muribaculaceae bacterium]